MAKPSLELPDKFQIPLIYREILEITLDQNGMFNVPGVEDKFYSMTQAYDTLRDRFPNVLPGFDAELIIERFPDRYSGGFSSLISSEDHRLFFSYSAKQRNKLWDINNEYKFFISNVYKRYAKKPKDFFNSYQFLIHHPAFWSLKGDIEKSGVLYWETNEGLEDMWHSVFKDKKGNVVHLLEVGGFLDESVIFEGQKILLPNRISSHDIDLDTYGKTYEKAIIKLARKVEKLYLPNGMPRKQ